MITVEKILTTILISLLFFFISPCNVEAQDINLSAEAAVLIDGDTGAIMYSKTIWNKGLQLVPLKY